MNRAEAERLGHGDRPVPEPRLGRDDLHLDVISGVRLEGERGLECRHASTGDQDPRRHVRLLSSGRSGLLMGCNSRTRRRTSGQAVRTLRKNPDSWGWPDVASARIVGASACGGARDRRRLRLRAPRVPRPGVHGRLLRRESNVVIDSFGGAARTPPRAARSRTSGRTATTRRPARCDSAARRPRHSGASSATTAGSSSIPDTGAARHSLVLLGHGCAVPRPDAGAASQHHRAEIDDFFGFDLARIFPYNLMRTGTSNSRSSGSRRRSSPPGSSSRR